MKTLSPKELIAAKKAKAQPSPSPLTTPPPQRSPPSPAIESGNELKLEKQLSQVNEIVVTPNKTEKISNISENSVSNDFPSPSDLSSTLECVRKVIKELS
jgi:hypothetical protein